MAMDSKIVGVYTITNQMTGRVYVGGSWDIYFRWHTHIRELDRGIHKRSNLQVDWNAQDPETFAFDIIEETTPDVLGEREGFWLQHFARQPSGVYNVKFKTVRHQIPPEWQTVRANHLLQNEESLRALRFLRDLGFTRNQILEAYDILDSRALGVQPDQVVEFMPRKEER